MARDRPEDLLCVDWYDGLLVNSDHLTHQDRRVHRLLAEVAGALADQPGLVTEGSARRTPHQIIELLAQSRDEHGLHARLNITRSFQALSPSGSLVIGLASRGGSTPTADLEARLPGQARTGADYLVCVKQTTRDDLSIKQGVDGENSLRLSYPALHAELVDLDSYRTTVRAEYPDSVVIGLLQASGDELIVATDYIPPVTRLDQTLSFDPGIVAALIESFNNLFHLSCRLTEPGGPSESMGAGLISRQNDYETLRTILLSKIGLIRNMHVVSPTRLLVDVVHPTAAWWNTFHDRYVSPPSEQRDSPVVRLRELGASLIDTTCGDLCCGTSDLLRDTKRFVDSIREVLA